MTDIISPLPFTLTNGTTADATQVMADLNEIRNDVNTQVPLAIAAGGAYVGCLTSIHNENILDSSEPLVALTTILDTSSIHSNSINPTRLTVPAGATKARLFINLEIQIYTANTFVGAYSNKNGLSDYFMFNESITVTGPSYKLSGVTMVSPCVAGDYYELRIASFGGITSILPASYLEIQFFN